MKIWMALIGLMLSTGNSYAQLTTTTSSDSILYLSAEENRFYVLLNQFRAALNIPQVQVHVALEAASKKHSEYMASTDYLDHVGRNASTSVQRMQAEGYMASWSGENIACGYADGVSTFRQWALSPGHLANMVNPNFRHIGISRAGTGNERCRFYWTNDFASFVTSSASVPSVTDIALINKAYRSVMGASYANDTLHLLNEQPAPSTNSNDGDEPVNDISIQCSIPNSIGKGVLTSMSDTTTTIQTKGNRQTGYSLRLSFVSNLATATYYPLLISGISVVKNNSYPLYVIFSPPTNRTAGFSIQFNTQTSQAQFDSYGSSSGVSASVNCILKSE